MKDIFITSTLKAEWNQKFNPRICEALEKKGITCHLPQRDTDQEGSSMEKYTQNIEGIDNAKKLLTIAINESINRGLEVAYAFGSGKKVIALTSKGHDLPVMSLGMCADVLCVDNLDEIDSYIEELMRLILK